MKMLKMQKKKSPYIKMGWSRAAEKESSKYLESMRSKGPVKELTKREFTRKKESL
jgi:hypothetical protein